jgi:hypothetical protein
MNSETLPDKSDRSFELDLGRVGLIVIVPVSMWAFYTTFQGLKDVTRQGPDDLVGIVGALTGAAAILSLLALSSWQLGIEAAAALGGRRRPHGAGAGLFVIIPSFLFFFLMSSFFSFTYYHANFFGLSSKRLEGELQPRALAAMTIPIADEAIRDANQTQIASVLATEGAQEWIGGVDALAKIAGDGGRQFDAIFKAKQADRQKAARELAVAEIERTKVVREQIASIQSEVQNLRRVVAAADEIIAPQEDNISKARSESEKETALARASEQGLDKTGKASCGPICISHQEAAKAKRLDAEKIDRALKEHRDRRQQALTKIDELNAKLLPLEEPAAGPPGSSVPVPPPTSSPPEMKSELTSLAAARENFIKDPALSIVIEAERSCKTILAAAKDLNATAGIKPTFDCTIRADDTRRLLAERETFKKREAEYNKSCATGGSLGPALEGISAQVRAREVPPADGLIKASNVIEQCIGLAGTTIGDGSKVNKAYDAIADFTRGKSLDRNRFLVAKEALWNFDSDARLALSVAFAQDLLILIYKFLADFYKYMSQPRRWKSVGAPVDVSDKPAETVDIRARKAMLRLAKPSRSDASRISDADIGAAQLQTDVEANLRALINSLGRYDHAWKAGDGIYEIDNAAIREIESDLLQRVRGGDVINTPIAVESNRPGDDDSAPRREKPDSDQTTAPTAQPATAAPPPVARPARRSLRELVADVRYPFQDHGSPQERGSSADDALLPASYNPYGRDKPKPDSEVNEPRKIGEIFAKVEREIER